MRTGSCKYGSNCRFHHPEPTIMAGEDSSSGYSKGRSIAVQGSSQSTVPWSSSRPTNETSYVPPMMYTPTQSIPSPTPEWNSYQVVFLTSLASVGGNDFDCSKCFVLC